MSVAVAHDLSSSSLTPLHASHIATSATLPNIHTHQALNTVPPTPAGHTGRHGAMLGNPTQTMTPNMGVYVHPASSLPIAPSMFKSQPMHFIVNSNPNGTGSHSAGSNTPSLNLHAAGLHNAITMSTTSGNSSSGNSSHSSSSTNSNPGTNSGSSTNGGSTNSSNTSNSGTTNSATTSTGNVNPGSSVQHVHNQTSTLANQTNSGSSSSNGSNSGSGTQTGSHSQTGSQTGTPTSSTSSTSSSTTSSTSSSSSTTTSVTASTTPTKSSGLVGSFTDSSNAQLNLASQHDSIIASNTAPIRIMVGGTLNGSGTVTGGTMVTINPGQHITPAQAVALDQIMSNGSQSLIVNGQGAATGGLVTLQEGSVAGVSALIVPTGVTVDAVGYTASNPLNVTGPIHINGTLLNLEQSSSATAVLNASNISVSHSGSITDILPSNLSYLNAMSASGLTINAINNVLNQGSITSGGVLNINAGGSISNVSTGSTVATISAPTVNLTSQTGSFTNSGTIAATVSHLTINSPNTITFQNTGGNLSANAGNINFRDSSYAGSGGLTLTGGNLNAQNVNINSGTGAVEANVNGLGGLVNINADSAHVTAATANLDLGKMNLTGDPSFYNTTGNVTINTNLTYSGQALAVVAHGDVDFASNVTTISTAGATGGNITILAGANFTSSGFPQGNNDTSSTLTVLGGVPGGGAINGASLTSINSSATAGAGGNVNIVAYGGINPTAGTVNLGNAAINTVGSTGSGNVTIIDGTQTAGNNLTVGSITTAGAVGGTGNITVGSATPTLGGPVTVAAGGNVVGTPWTMGSGLAGNVSTGAISANGANITLEAGSASTNGNIHVAGNITDTRSTAGNGGVVTIDSGSSTAFSVGASTANSVTNNILANNTAGGTGGQVIINQLGTGGVTIANTGTINVGTTSGTGGTVDITAGTGAFTATNATGTISAAGAGSVGSGGAIDISAGSFALTGGPLVLNANGTAAGSGAGGQINLSATGTGSTITVGNAAGNIELNVNSGSTGGNAGSVSVSTGGNLTVNSTTGILANVLGAGAAGNGATIDLQAGKAGAGSLAITGSLNGSAGSGGGSGGTVSLISNSATAFNIDGGGANGISGTITANAGGVAGNAAGTVFVQNKGTGGINLSVPAAIAVNASAAGGNGGNVTLDAGPGTLTLAAGTLNANATGPGSFNGGTITLNGNAIAIPGGAFTTSANGAGGGNGGVVTVTAATGNIGVGTTAGNLIVSTTGGSAGSATGNGGTVNLTASTGNVTVSNPAAFEVGPLGLNGNGSNITLSAGSTSAAGNLLVTGSLSANGIGTGAAGDITLFSNSTTAFTIGSAPGLNGVSGTVSASSGATATGASAGNVSITNAGTGGITLASDTAVAANAPIAGGNGGNISLLAPNGPVTLPNGTLSVNGTGATGNGGTITITDNTLTAGTVAFSANASGTGNGGIISITSADPAAKNIDAADLSFSATGGSAGSAFGSGGSVTFINAGSVTVDPTAITDNPIGTSGNGGTIKLASTSGDLLVTNSIQVNGVGGGAGGTVSLSSNSASPFTVTNVTPGPNGVDGTVSATGSSGGNISLNNTGSGGVTLTSTSVLNNAATAGNGGNLSITSSGGPINIPPGTFNVSAVGVTNGNGGNVTIIGTDVNVTPPSAPLNIMSNGLGTGNAGAVNVVATAAGSTLSIGPGNGDINITGNAGATNTGLASPVIITSGGNLTVDPAGLNLLPAANGDGTTVVLTAGTSGTGNLLVTGNIDVSGAGTGNGGSVTLTSASATPFTVNQNATVNGIDGTISANGGPQGGNAGSITINALGVTGGANGGINLGPTTNVSFNPLSSGAGGNGGNLTLNATNPAGSDGPITTNGGTLNASALGTGTQSGGTITFSSSVLNVNPATGPLILTANGAPGSSGNPGGNGGTINVTTTSATGDITVGNTTGQIETSATGGGSGSTSGNGGTIALSAGGNLTVTDTTYVNVAVLGTNGNGGNISLASSTKATNDNMQVTGNLSANGAGTGNGGTVNLSYSSTAGALTVGSATAGNFVTGNINADAPGTGNGGTVTIANAATGSNLDINLTNNAVISANAATASYPSNTTPLGNLILNSATGNVDVAGAGKLTGFINSQGTSVTVDPTATGAVTTVGAISATNGNAVINASNGTVAVPLGHIASATGNININTQTFYIDGTVTTSGAAASINVNSPGNLYVGGNGLMQVTGGGAASINVVANTGDMLTLDKAPVYAPGAAGTVLFSAIGTGGQIVLDAGTNQNMRDGNPATIQSPSLIFNNDAAFTARGATVYTVDSGPAGSNQPLTITTAQNGSGQIQTSGGSINITNNDSGQPITFASSSTTPPPPSTTLNLDGGPVTVTQNNSSTTVNSGVNVLSDNNITMNANEGSVINNGLISTSKASGFVDILSNADLTVGGTGTISVTGGGAGAINVDASNGVTTGHFLDFTGSQTFNAGTGGSVTWSSPYCPPAGTMGSVNISAGQTELVQSGVPLTIITPILTFGAASGITDTATSGTGINVVSGGDCWLTVTTPTGSTAAMTTSGANFNFSTGPVGGPAAVGDPVIFNQSGTGNSQLTLNGGTVTTTSSGANTTVTSGTTILANNSITMNVNNGTLQADGTIHSTTATGAAGTINVLSTGTLGLNSTGNITVDPTAANGGAGGTINVNAAGALTVQAGNLDASAVLAGTGTGGAGGTISVTSSTLAITGGAPLSLTANAAGAGNGGSISVKTTSATGDITVSPGAGGVSFQAQGGATSGNGGTVNVTAGNNLTLASATNTIDVTPLSTTGNGGTVNLTGSNASGGGTLTLGQSVNTNALAGGTGSGGAISVVNNSTALLSIPSGTLSADSGSLGGIGGKVTVTNNLFGVQLQGDITATGASNTSPTAGNSGQIAISSTGGKVEFDGGTLNASGTTGAANSSGGAVTVTASSITQPSGTEIFQANGSGIGAGGKLSLTTTGATGDITLGAGFQLNATGGSAGSASGNGGSVTVSAGRALDLGTGSIDVTPKGTSGNGGSVALTASTSAPGAMSLSETINANGVGTGNGGTVAITDNSNNAIVIPTSGISANSGTTGYGGSVSITNTGNAGGNGGIEIQSGTISATGSANTALNHGSITVNAVGGTNSGLVQLDGGSLTADATGAGNSNGGAVSVAGGTVSLTGVSENLTANASGTGNGGSVSISTVGVGGNITVGTSGSGLNLSATGGSAGSTSGNGGAVTVSASGNLSLPNGAAIAVNPLGNNGNGGTINLTGGAGTANASGYVAVNQGLTADGAGTGTGGTILVSYKDPTAADVLSVGSATGNNYVDGAIHADGGATGNGGAVTITNTSTTAGATLTVQQTADITAAGGTTSGALGNINFPTAVANPLPVSVTGDANLTGLVNSNGTSVYIYPHPATATTLTVGTITATTGDASAFTDCSNGSLTIIPVGSSITTTGAIGDVQLMGTTVTNNGNISSSRDVYVQTPTYTQASGTMNITRDLNFSTCTTGTALTVNASTALTAGRNITFDVSDFTNSPTPGQITVNAPSILAGSNADTIEINPGTSTASITSTGAIRGEVVDPLAVPGSTSDTVTVTANSATTPLEVGQIDAQQLPGSTFTATNLAVGGNITTVGNIIANGSAGTPVTLKADNIINDFSVTAASSDLTLTSTGAGHALTVSQNANGLLSSTNGNVNFNLPGATAQVTVTGTGDITAPSATNGYVNLNIGNSTATVAANAILGCVEDPGYATTPSGNVSISVAQNYSAGNPLTVGNFAATQTGATFLASNAEAGGAITTCGPITTASTLTLKADNVTNNAGGTGFALTSNSGDVVVESSANGRTLALDNANLITATNGNVDLNGTSTTTTGAVTVTGTGSLIANAGDFINVNLGAGAANISQTTLQGIVRDPNASATAGSSGSVLITDASSTTLQLGTFGSTSTISVTNSGGSTGTGDVSIATGSFATTSITLSASGAHASINDFTGSYLTTGATGSVILSANGGLGDGTGGFPGGVGNCDFPVFTNTPFLTLNAPNGSVRVTDSAAAQFVSANSANGSSALTSFHVEDDATSAGALGFQSGSSITSFNTVLNTTAGGIDLTNANIQATAGAGVGNVEIVSYLNISGTPTTLNPGALILDSTNGDIGTNATPFVVTTPTFSASAPLGSVYINDTSAGVAGVVTIVNPDTTNIACGITITSANTALNNYYVEATNANATNLVTGSGVTVTTTGASGHVAAVAPHGAVGNGTTPFATATNNVTANAGNGLVNVSNNNGTNPVTLVGGNILGTTLDNSASTTYTFTQAGAGALNNNDQVTGGTGVTLNTPGTINNQASAHITATTGNVTLASISPTTSPLTVNTSTGSLITATTGNINFNTTSAPGQVSITGTGDITAPSAVNGFVNLNIGSSTATVAANAIVGCVEDPESSTTPSGTVSITVAQDYSAGNPLTVGNFAATQPGATFTATNSSLTGGVSTCGNITADGNTTLSASNVTNTSYTVTSNNGNVIVSGTGSGALLTLANSGSLVSDTGTVDLNAAGAEGPVLVTGTGTISAATSVNTNIGSGTANITQGTISGLIQDPLAGTTQSGTVAITVSSATALSLGAFNSSNTVTAINNGNAISGIGDVTISANTSGTNGVIIKALGSNGNITDVGGFTLTSPTSVTLLANGGPTSGVGGISGGVGDCASPVLVNTPVLTANAQNGSVRVTDSAAVVVTGTNTANGTNSGTSYHLEDDAAVANAISFAGGSTLTAFTTILNTPNGGINLTNANIAAGGGAGTGNIEIVTKDDIAGVPTTNFAPGTLILASTNGSIGAANAPLITGATNISASAPTGGVYIDDTNTGTVNVVNPNTAGLHCGLTITGPNTAATRYFIEGSGSLVTGTGVTVTAPSVVVSATNNIGTGLSAFSTATQTLSAEGGGNVSIANGSATTTTLQNQTVGTNTYNNSAGGTYTISQTGGGDLSVANNNNVTGTSGVSITTAVLNLGLNSDVTSTGGNVNIANTGGAPLTVNLGAGSNIQAAPSGSVNFDTPGSPGQITVTGTSGTISGGITNFNGGVCLNPVTVNVGLIASPITVTGDIVNITTQTGNVDVVNNIDACGNVSLIANTGAVTAQNITTNYTSGSAGNITITSQNPTTFGNLNADGTGGASAGNITITAPTVTGGYIDATTSGSTLPGGNLNISTTTLALSGRDGAGASINVSNTSNTGDGGTVNLNTTSTTVFTVGPGGAATGNGTNGAILANGVDGGFLTLTNAGNLTVNPGGLIEANGTTGTGGHVLIQNSTTPGTNPLVVTNNGTIEAISNSATTGLIGLNGGPGAPITVLGNGDFIAGECTHIGNLNQTTLDFLTTPSGTITVSATLTFIPHYCTRSEVVIINIPKPVIVHSHPNTTGRHLGSGLPAVAPVPLIAGAGANTASTPAANPLLGEIAFFGQQQEQQQQQQFPLDSKTPTDTTQVTNFANIDQMVNPVAEEKDKSLTSDLIEGSKTFRDEFADDEKARLNQEHVLIGSNTQKNFFNLDKGNVVFNPSKDIVVQTHEGEIYIAAGSNVFVMENGHDVVIYNLHDGKRNAVSIISAKKKMTLEPGRMLVLSRQDTRDFEKITAGFHGIGYRNIKEVDLDSSIKAFYGDFSIPSALTLVVPLKKMFASSEPADRAAVDRILKTSVILSNFIPSNSPFNGGMPAR
ncbi:MAG: hypothetical protein P4L53_16970 [Candidatus Obscuribacterales bacterium]|nr:hypothetical protein [Candidatus Obscuribacterales bacterium]